MDKKQFAFVASQNVYIKILSYTEKSTIFNFYLYHLIILILKKAPSMYL